PLVPAGIAARTAQLPGAERLALGAQPDLPRHPVEGRCEVLGQGGPGPLGPLEDVIGQARRGALAHPGQPPQLQDELTDGIRAHPPCPDPEPPGVKIEGSTPSPWARLPRRFWTDAASCPAAALTAAR